MDSEQFNEWLENPITEYFFKYLTDSAKDEADLVAEMITSGGILSDLDQKRIATTCATLISIAEIEFEEIDSFYSDEKE